MSKKPNFLFIITDQQRADHLGCYGGRVLQTPHVDSIAARGTRFDRFYVAAPLCMPNRSTIMTGRMPTLHGVRHNGIPLSLNATTFVDVLRAAGYRTALVGKSHLQNFTGEPPELDFDGDGEFPDEELSEADRPRRMGDAYDNENTLLWVEDPDRDVATPFYGFEHVRLCTMHGDRVQGHYTKWLTERLPEQAELRKPGNALPDDRYSAHQARRTPVPEELYPTNYVADMTIEFLEKHAAKDGDSPFFIQCSFPDPHHPFTPPGAYWDKYDPADVELPPSFYHSPHDQTPPLAAIHTDEARRAAEKMWVRPFAVSEDEAKQITALTYGMEALIDDAVGRVLARLSALGLADDTVVVYTSDHGDWMGDHGIMLKGPLHYQSLVRVPMVWADPAAPEKGVATGALGGSVDIARSILERAGIARFHGMQGESLLPLCDGAASAHDGILIEQETQRAYLGFDRPVRIRSYLTERWRLTLWEGQDWGELYDLESDPHEIENRWSDPACGSIKSELMERMLRTMIDLQDRAPPPTGQA